MRLAALAVVAAVLVGIAFTRTAAAALPPSGAEALYEHAAPAIAYLETPIAAGSGILFEGGYLLTDAHVVWPYDTVKVRFPDGRTIREAPVVAEDSLADLAVVRVGDVPGVTPLRFGDPARLDVGSDVYLIGYPAERESNPTPTLSRGLLSRVRVGGPLRLHFAQTDAVTAGGASGGAMLSAAGEVVGVIQLRFPSTTFSLALSGAEAIERMRAQLAAPGELGRRAYGAISAAPVASDQVRIGNQYEQQGYLLRTLSDTEVTVRASSEDAVLSVFDPSGIRVTRSSATAGGVRATFRATARQPYVVAVSAAKAGAFEVSADHPIVRIPDPDDGRALTAGGYVLGSFDYYTDTDVYTLDLRAGQTVTITAESTLADAVVIVTRADNPGGPSLDSSATSIERGLLGNDAIVAFTASADRRYLVTVTDFSLLSGPQHGAYRLSVFPSPPARTAQGYAAITSGERPGETTSAFVFGGGSEDELVAATGCDASTLRIWASLTDGRFVAFVPGAFVSQVNEAWHEAFPFGVPANTALLGQCPRV